MNSTSNPVGCLQHAEIPKDSNEVLGRFCGCERGCRNGKRKDIKDLPSMLPETCCIACSVYGMTHIVGAATTDLSQDEVPEGFQRGKNGELVLGPFC